MSETKQEVTLRKIRNGLRKQKEALDAKRHKEIWDALNGEHTKGWQPGELDTPMFYAPYIPLMTSRRKGMSVLYSETTA